MKLKNFTPLLSIFLLNLASAQTDTASNTFNTAWQSITKYGFWGIVIFVAIVIFGGIAVSIGIWKWQKRKWYLKVILKMPREGGRTINCEIAKGYWDSRQATLWVKREG
ncbi:MAG: hypothetical protein WD512_15400, partial [Candidatus Paceibacterota bacterium]